ncbi:IclR family transcriptional regulator domain-containing protein [Streptomyces coelicoflavus]|uniref:IclR family transcriptional regulator domain-containing protein n=1 Tax=Streptomyces coelicoflavus TaxID=285562 RepID=UPI0036342765
MHGEPVLERAFRVLGAEAGEGLALHTPAARAGLPKSTTSRIAAQLTDVGALERLDNGDFVVGLHLLEIAPLAPRGHGLRAAALRFMQDLHRVTGQHILLAVRDGDEAVLVERLSARDAGAVKYRVGGRLPLFEAGIGIALLAHAPGRIRKEARTTRPASAGSWSPYARTASAP